MQQVNSKIREQRLRLGLTLVELAELCVAEGAQADNSQLSRYERGESVPRPRLRAVLARILDLDVTDFELTERIAESADSAQDVA